MPHFCHIGPKNLVVPCNCNTSTNTNSSNFCNVNDTEKPRNHRLGLRDER